jgi:hypothetical protein
LGDRPGPAFTRGIKAKGAPADEQLVAGRGLLVFASAAVVAAAVAVSAPADNYRFAKTPADNLLAKVAVLKRTDLPSTSTLRGGLVKPDESPTTVSDSCNGRSPKESDLVVTGDAASRFADPSGALVIYTQAAVFSTSTMAAADVARSLPFINEACMRQAMSANKAFHFISFKRLPSLKGYENDSYLLDYTRTTSGHRVEFLMAGSVVVHARTEVAVLTQLQKVVPSAVTLIQTIQSRALYAVATRI